MSHPTEPLFKGESTTPQKPVKDYLIVPQNSSDRPTWYASNDLYTGLATSLETDLGFNAFDFFLPEGGGPPLHYHVYENEAWYGIAGDLLFSFGNQGGEQETEPEYTLNVPAGTLIFGPRLRPHTYNNIDSTEATIGENVGARTLSFTTPGGLDLFFDYVGLPVEDRNAPIPLPGPPTPEVFAQLAEIGGRTSGAPYFIIPEADYQPPEDALDYVVVLPANPEGELVEAVLPLKDVEGFSIWQSGNDANIPLPSRPTFTGPLGIEYTSLLTLEETGGEMEYNQFSLAPQETETNVYASLSAAQVVEPTASSATGSANLQLNDRGEIEYSITVSGLDFGELISEGSPQTAANELDDVTKIHIHSGESGTNGPHAFNILDPQEQQENDLSINLNADGSATISGVWNQAEQEIPQDLKDFLAGNNLPGAESDFYLQIHTQGNSKGEIRGQIGLTTEDFAEPITSDEREAFYVKDGYLSLKIDDEVKLIEPDTLVYIAPGQEYSLGNFGTETVDSLAVTIPEQPESAREIASPLQSQADSAAYTTVFLGAEADVFNHPAQSDRRVYGGQGNDELFANQSDRLFGEAGDDILDASGGKSNNLLDGGAGNDELLGASNGELVGGDGNDTLRIVNGGNNLLYGNGGADRFWLANDRIPDTVTETRQLTELGLPNLEDTRNTIADFELDVDKIGISGVSGISSFDDLKLLPAFGDIQSTSIIATVDGIEGEISLGNIVDVQFNQLSADDFVFA